MPRRQRGDTSSNSRRPHHQCPVSKSGDCAALKAQKGRFESDAGHQFGAATGAELSLARMIVLGSIPRCSTKFIPVKRTGCVHPTVNRTAAGSNPATGANCRVRLLARIPGSQPGEMGSIPIRGSSFLPVAQPDERRATNAEDAGSTPAGKANHQGVGEPSRPRLPWKQENVGANPTTLTIRCPLLRAANTVQWRNGNATACKAVMSRIDTGLHLHALVAQLEERAASTCKVRGSRPRESANILDVDQPEDRPCPKREAARSSRAVEANPESEREGSRAPPAKRSVAKAMSIVRSALRQCD